MFFLKRLGILFRHEDYRIENICVNDSGKLIRLQMKENINMIFIFKLNICVYEGEVKVVQSLLTLCDPRDYTVHGIL